MLGADAPYRRPALVLVRPVRREAADRRAERRLGAHRDPARRRGPAASRSGTAQGDRLLAVDAMNDPRAYMTAKRWIEAGVSPDPARRRRPRRRPQGARLMRIVGGRHRGLDARRARRRRRRPRSCARPPTGCARASSTCSPTGPTATRRRREGRRVLDLFAGTGALGLEALSRGAAAATFVETGPAALALLRRNLALARAEEAAPRARAATPPGSGRNPGAAVRPRLPRPALRPRPRRAGARLGARRRLGRAGRARGLGGGRQPCAARPA